MKLERYDTRAEATIFGGGCIANAVMLCNLSFETACAVPAALATPLGADCVQCVRSVTKEPRRVGGMGLWRSF